MKLQKLIDLALKLGAYNCYCLVNTRLGEHLAVRGLQSLYQHVLRGRPPEVMVILGDVYALFPVEEVVLLLLERRQANSKHDPPKL